MPGASVQQSAVGSVSAMTSKNGGGGDGGVEIFVTSKNVVTMFSHFASTVWS